MSEFVYSPAGNLRTEGGDGWGFIFPVHAYCRVVTRSTEIHMSITPIWSRWGLNWRRNFRERYIDIGPLIMSIVPLERS